MSWNGAKFPSLTAHQLRFTAARRGRVQRLPTVGAGVDFPKSFKKFALLAKKKKFPEISLASGLGQRISPKFPALRGLPPLHAS